MEKPASSQAEQNWEIIPQFTDDFNNDTIDWANKWSKTTALPNVSAWQWDNDINVKSNNGIAELIMRHNENNEPGSGGTYFTSGIIQSQTKTCYGYYESRIKGSSIPQTSDPSNYPFDWYGRGVCPAFWLWSFDYSEPIYNGKRVKYSEIDIVEIQQFDYYQGQQYFIQDLDLNLHTVIDGNWVRPKNDPENQKNEFHMNADPTEDFHIYGVENRPDSIFWYVDGELVAAKRNLYWHLDMNLTVSLGVRVPFVVFQNNSWAIVNPVTNGRANAKLTAMYDTLVNPDEPGTTKMHLDYIRSWKALPSVWYETPDSCSYVGYLNSKVLFHPGTGNSVSGSIESHLVEKDIEGNNVQIVASNSDNSVNGLYGGSTNISMKLDSITPTSGLETGNYYALESSFTNSNSEEITESSEPIYITESATGIKELESNTIQIGPNPVDDIIYLTDSNNRMYDMNLYNSQGMLIRQYYNTNQLNVSHLNSGIYFLRIENKVYKFVKK